MIKDLKLEKRPVSEYKDKLDEDYGLPVYKEELDLNAIEEEELIKDILEEFGVLETQREELDLDTIWDNLDKQYRRIPGEDSDAQFEIIDPMTTEKVDAIVGDTMAAFFPTDQVVYTVGARAEFTDEANKEICTKQENFLDAQIDTKIPLAEEFELGVLSAVLKGNGILKVTHEIDTQKKKRDVYFEGGKKGIEEYKKKYNDDILMAYENQDIKEMQKHEKYLIHLSSGKELYLVESYDEILYNDPLPQFVNLKDFYIRPDTDGYRGMSRTKLIVEKQNYSYWELQCKERDGEFYNIEDIAVDAEGNDLANPELEDYEILECTYFASLDGEDKEPTKIKMWIHEETKTSICAIKYPWYGIASDYLNLVVRRVNKGFYQPGVGEELTDLNTVQNCITNFTLEAAYNANRITPIVEKNSNIAKQFINKRWVIGVPLMKERNEGQIDFLNNHIKFPDVGALLALGQNISRKANNISGVSDYTTGQESISDPSAPASKTMALMERTNKNIKRYILKLKPSFDEISNMFLQMYYQISNEAIKYKPRAFRSTNDPFDNMTRQDMIARTTIESQAHTFDFDRNYAKQMFMEVYQLVRQEPIVAQNPQAVYHLLKELLKAIGPSIKNELDSILPNPDVFQKQIVGQLTNNIINLVGSQIQIADQTQTRYTPDPEQLAFVITNTLKDSATPVSKDEAKQRDSFKEQKGML